MSENKMATKADLQRMYNKILPYLGGTAEAGFTPVGTVIAVMGNTAPANYLSCNGQAVNIADYPVLADYFEAQFGTKNHFGGDGVTTFAVPDLRGEFLRGTGTNSHENQGGGANVGVHQDATAIPNLYYNHDSGMFQIGVNESTGWQGIRPADTRISPKYFGLYSATEKSNDTNGGYVTTRPTNTSVLYCIATHNIFMNPELQYSTQEQVVGTWIDGKPIYQKTIDLGYGPNKTVKNIPHGISNFGRLIDFICIGNLGDEYWGLNYPNTSDSGSTTAAITVKTSNVSIIAKGDASSEYYYITIQYTKTTD